MKNGPRREVTGLEAFLQIALVHGIAEVRALGRWSAEGRKEGGAREACDRRALAAFGSHHRVQKEGWCLHQMVNSTRMVFAPEP